MDFDHLNIFYPLSYDDLRLICDSIFYLIHFLQLVKVILPNPLCSKNRCGKTMNLQRYSGNKNFPAIFRCCKHKTQKNPLLGSIFEQSSNSW